MRERRYALVGAWVSGLVVVVVITLAYAFTNPQRHVPTGRLVVLAVFGVIAASTLLRARKRA